MPINYYTPYANGTWEVSFQTAFKLLGSSGPAAYCGNFDVSNEYVIQGNNSARLIITADATLEFSGTNKYARSPFHLRAGGPADFNYIPLVAGNRYTMTLKVRTPAANPVADDDAIICLGNINQFINNNAVWTDLGGGKYKVVTDGENEYIVWRVSAIKDTTVELSFTWTEAFDGLNYSYENPDLLILLKQFTGGPSNIPIVGTKSLLVGGKLFFDQGIIGFEGNLPACSLVFNSPAYSKLDESALDANDGIITIHVHHQNPADNVYTNEFSIDGVTWQLSNIFYGVAPGVYSIYARDSSGIGCQVQMLDAVTIIEVEETAPICDLNWLSPPYTKTNETAVDANDGTITILAKHNDPANDIYVKEFSINNADWFLTNVFTDLAPGVYSVYVRDNSGAFCVLALGGVEIVEFVEDEEPPPEPPDPAPLLVNIEPVNNRNFINWFTANGNSNFSGGLTLQNCSYALPRPYRYEKTKLQHAPIVVADEVFTFYINFDTPITYEEFSSLKLALIKNGGMVHSEIGLLKKDTFEDGIKYNMYSDQVVIPLGTPVGKYRMMIYHSVTGDVLFVSNVIELMSITDAPAWSISVWHRSSINLYKYYYERVTSFINKIRLRLYLIDDQVEGEISQYRGASTGRLRNVSVELDKFIVLEAHYFDDLAHDAMFIFQVQDVILLNQKPYLVKTLYKKETHPALNVCKGKLELYEQDFSTGNRFGEGDITIVGSEDPLLLGDGGSRIRI